MLGLKLALGFTKTNNVYCTCLSTEIAGVGSGWSIVGISCLIKVLEPMLIPWLHFFGQVQRVPLLTSSC